MMKHEETLFSIFGIYEGIISKTIKRVVVLNKIEATPSCQIGDTFKMLEENTGVQRLYIAYGLAGIIVLWLAFGFGAQVGSSSL